MPLGNLNLELLNLNAERAYPFTDVSSRTDISGSLKVPDSFIVALQFSIYATSPVSAASFFVNTLTLTPTGFSVTVGYDDGSPTPPTIAVAVIPQAGHVENQAYPLVGLGDFVGCSGLIAIGDLTDINAQPAGFYQFSPSGGQLEPVTIWPMIQCLSSITIVNGADQSLPITGDIELVAGANVSITFAVVGDVTQIVINAIAGAGLNQNCDCVGNGSATTGVPIRRINGIGPDSNGNFQIGASSCISLTPTTNGLTLANTCSTPCCGCAELAAVQTNLNSLSNGVTTFQGAISRLAAEVSQMSLTVLSSRLGDTGNCTT